VLSLDEQIQRSGAFILGFKEGAKWQQEQHDFLPGFIKQFDPEEGELDEGGWTVSRFLKWLELNKFKIGVDRTLFWNYIINNKRKVE
jgi:hypothetical protein